MLAQDATPRCDIQYVYSRYLPIKYKTDNHEKNFENPGIALSPLQKECGKRWFIQQ